MSLEKPKSLKLIYFGSAGALSLIPFSALVKSRHVISAFVVHVPAPDSFPFSVIQTDQPGSVQALALKNNIPVIRCARDFSVIASQLKSLQADVIVTSCFDLKLPPKILGLPSIASINIHPSLLPQYRGPNPVFWQLRHAEKMTGVSLHLMTECLDAGDIIAQESIDMKELKHFSEMIRKQAKVAARLLVNVLDNIVLSMLQVRRQESEGASYFTFPEIADFEISAEWTASRIFEFMTMTRGMTPYYPVILKGKEYKLLTVSDYHFTDLKSFTDEQGIVCFPCIEGHICAEFLTG